MHILCPHCRNPIELARINPREEITCQACGSSFTLDLGTTTDAGTAAGQKVGKFEVLEVVGQGAFGTVYRARDPELDRVVALKLPRAGSLAGQQERDRFLREARSAAQLRHPSIVSVHAVGEADGVPYLVSDFVRGVTLADVLSARRPGFREAAELIATIAEALQYAHERGVVHRDVKPSNVMIGDDGKPMVMDFGLARRDAGEVTMTVEGQILGTPAYMPPEQARGEGHRVDARGDVYSLGVVLYQLLTGELPFRGTQRMLLHQVLTDEPKPPRALNDRIPRDLETVCLKAMAKEPPRRFAAAKEMADDLRRFLAGEPIRARPVGAVEKAARWMRRYPAAAGLMAVSVIAMLALVGVAVGLSYNAELKQSYLQEASLREVAEGAKAAEETARLGEEKERKVAQAALAKADWLGYIHSIFLADVALREGNRELARRRLDECKKDLRNWEWYYLNNQCSPELYALPGVEAAFSPDGSRLAVTDAAGEVVVADAWTGVVARRIKAATPLQALGFTPDGKRVVAVPRPKGYQPQPDNRFQLVGSVAVFDAVTGAEVLSRQYGDDMTVSPDQATVASAEKDGTVRLYDLESGKILHTLKDDKPLRNPQFSPDGGLLRASHAGKPITPNPGGPRAVQTFPLFDARTGQKLWTFDLAETPVSPTASVQRLPFSPDSRRYLFIHPTGVTVHDARTRAGLFPLAVPPPTRPDEPDFAADYAFSPDGLRIAVRMFGGHVHLFDGRTGKLVVTLRGRLGGDPSFSPDGSLLVVGQMGSYAEGNALVFDARTGSPLPPLLAENGLTSPGFSPDGTRVAAVDRGTVRVFDARLRAGVHPPGVGVPSGSSLLGLPAGRVLVFTRDGTRLAFPTLELDTIIIDPRSGTERLSVRPQWEHGMRPNVSPAGARMLVATPQFKGDAIGAVILDLLDLRTGQRVWTVTDVGIGSRAAFSPDGTRLVVPSSQAVGGNVRVLDAATGRDLLSFPLAAAQPAAAVQPGIGPTDLSQQVSFSPDSKRIAAQANDGKVVVYDATTGAVAVTVPVRSGRWIPVFSPDGTHLAVVSSPEPVAKGQTVHLHDAKTGAHLKSFPWPAGTSRPEYSPDGRRLVGVSEAEDSADRGRLVGLSEAGQIHLVDAQSGATLVTVQGTKSKSIPRFSPDGSRLVSVSTDGVLRVYDVDTGAEVFARGGISPGVFPEFTADGESLAVVGDDNLVKVFHAPRQRDAWTRLRQDAVREGRADWQRTRAEECERNREWFAAAFARRWQLAESPGDATAKYKLGLSLARLGQQPEASQAFTAAFAATAGRGDLAWVEGFVSVGRFAEAEQVLRPSADASEMLDDYALLLLRLGDRAAYRKLCPRLLDLAGKPGSSQELLRACTLAADGLPDYAAALTLAQKVVNKRIVLSYQQRTLARLQVRAGRYDDALAGFRQAREKDEARVKAQPGTRFPPDPQSALFLAIAHHHRGKPAEARAALDEARKLAEQLTNATWQERLAVEVLRREAEDLLRAK